MPRQNHAVRALGAFVICTVICSIFSFAPESAEGEFPFRSLKTAPTRALINYNYDVLAAN